MRENLFGWKMFLAGEMNKGPTIAEFFKSSPQPLFLVRGRLVEVRARVDVYRVIQTNLGKYSNIITTVFLNIFLLLLGAQEQLIIVSTS